MNLAAFLIDRCRSFGVVHGLRLAVGYARESRTPKGRHFKLRPPGIAHPVTLRARTSDIQVFEQIFGRREMEFPLRSEPRTIVDAGANIGMASIALAHRYPTARIFSLELDGENHRLLVENTRPYPQITPLHCGLWSHATRLRIDNPEAESWALRGAEASRQDDGIEAIGISDLVQRFGLEKIDLLKMDIEGGELQVLGNNIESWIGRVSALAVELHEHWVPGCAAALDRVLERHPGRTTKFGEYDIVEFSK